MRRPDRRLAAALAVTVLTAGLAGCGGEAPTDDVGRGEPVGAPAGSVAPSEPPWEPPAAPTVPALVREADDLSTFTGALQAADLDELLEGPGPFTVFAPSNEAFAAAFDEDEYRVLQSQAEELAALLEWHVVRGAALDIEDLAGREEVETLGGAVPVTTEGGAVVLGDGARVIGAGLQAGNGVVHVVDGVLGPAPGD